MRMQHAAEHVRRDVGTMECAEEDSWAVGTQPPRDTCGASSSVADLRPTGISDSCVMPLQPVARDSVWQTSRMPCDLKAWPSIQRSHACVPTLYWRERGLDCTCMYSLLYSCLHVSDTTATHWHNFLGSTVQAERSQFVMSHI